MLAIDSGLLPPACLFLLAPLVGGQLRPPTNASFFTGNLAFAGGAMHVGTRDVLKP